MNQLVPIRADATALSGKQLDLIKRTVAKDCNAAEFDHFMHTASHLGLDPLRKQVLCVVFNKDKPDKRQMTIIVPQDGLRVIAARQRDYGPARDEPEIDYDPALKSDLNPHGIVRAKVTLWKRYADGWQPVVGVAYWDEFAPIEDEWAYDPEQGKRRPTGKQKLAENWKRMGRVMIAKCATCQALRAGWPDDFAGVYGEEEIQRAVVIDAASEIIAEYQETERLTRVGGRDALLFLFDPAGALENVERGKIADRLTAFYEREVRSAQEIIDFRTRNEAALKTFWAWTPADALEVKKIAERRLGELAKKSNPAGAAGVVGEGAGKAENGGAAGQAGAEASPASSSSFEALKEACLACLQSKTKRRALSEWRKEMEAATGLSAPEIAELNRIEQNVREELSR